MSNEDLIAEARSNHWINGGFINELADALEQADAHIQGMTLKDNAFLDMEDRALRAEGALEAATRVPVQGEPNARVVTRSLDSDCALGVCMKGCSHLMWACDSCSSEGGWGATRDKLKEWAAEHVCPPPQSVQGEPNDDREVLDNVLIDAREAGDGLSAVRNRILAAGFSRATVPDAATEELETLRDIAETHAFCADRLSIEKDRADWVSREICDRGCSYTGGPDEECSAHGRTPRELWEFIAQDIVGRDAATARAEKAEAERDAALAAVERCRAAVEKHKHWNEDCGWDVPAIEVLAALDGAPEPEWEYECRISAPWDWRKCAADSGMCPEGSERRKRTPVIPAGPWLPIEKEQSND